MTLIFSHHINLPQHSSGGFDHADVHDKSGRVFVAHTANNSVEIIDEEGGVHVATVPGCQEASGVLCAQEEDLIFAAARGRGRILIIDALTGALKCEVAAGSKPNGLAWDIGRKQLLVADTKDFHARLLDPYTGRVLATAKLPGRPRWCKYSHSGDNFWVAIRDPSGISMLAPETAKETAFLPVSVAGAHGLDFEEETGRAFVACDGKAVVVLDLRTGHEIDSVNIAGEPDVVWYNPLRHRLYCAIPNPGVIDVIDTLAMTLDEEIETEEGTQSLTFDQLRQRLYIFLPQSCRAAVYEER